MRIEESRVRAVGEVRRDQPRADLGLHFVRSVRLLQTPVEPSHRRVRGESGAHRLAKPTTGPRSQESAASSEARREETRKTTSASWFVVRYRTGAQVRRVQGI